MNGFNVKTDASLNFVEYQWRRCKKSGHHVAKFISREEILDPENFCLVNDKLTVACEVRC